MSEPTHFPERSSYHHKSIHLEKLFTLCLFTVNGFDVDLTARQRNISDKSLHRTLRQLEEEAGVELYYRAPRQKDGLKRKSIDIHNFALTRAGNLLVAKTAPVLLGLFDLESKLRIDAHRAKTITPHRRTA